jgi:hypothetical protein
MEFNPLGTIFDQVVDHSWMEGDNNEDRSWNLQGLKVGVSVAGTVNDVSDTDTAWYCEVAIPYDSLGDTILPAASRPADGVSWRLQLARYNRNRDSQGNVTGDPETSLWNMTGNPWFHVPSRFGRILFSEELVTSVSGMVVCPSANMKEMKLNVYPNPVEKDATITFSLGEEKFVTVKIVNILGKTVETVTERTFSAGQYRLRWIPGSLPPGVYFCEIRTDLLHEVKKIFLRK